MSWLLRNFVDGPVDWALVSASEAAKAVVNEVWHLGAQIANGASAIALGIVHKPGFQAHIARKRGVYVPSSSLLSKSDSSDNLCPFALFDEDEEDPVVSTTSYMPTATTRSPTPSLSSPLSSKPKTLSPATKARRRRSANEHIPHEHDVVWNHEHLTTGLFQDVREGILLLIEKTTSTLRRLIPQILHSIITFSWLLFLLNPVKIWHTVREAFRLVIKFVKSFHPKNFVSSSNIDRRTKQEIVNQAGYPYESYRVITEDGYVLLLERVGRVHQGKVVYLQHGVMANGFDWVANGPTQSLAFKAFELGYDVWIGNFRGGSGPEYKHIVKDISNASYWDFSMNEHAMRDIPAFIKTILSTKKREFAELGIKEDIDITAIAHSMGAASTIMYMVKSGLDGIPHHLSRAILLSVAGYHQAAPLLCKVTGPVLYKLLHMFPVIHSFRFPSEIYRIVASKVMQDVKNSPAMKDLISYFVAKLLGGSPSSQPFTKVHNLAYNTFLGTPVKIFFHFWQIYRARRFQMFDYGPARNLVEYGQSTPIGMFENYDKIYVPVHFVMGMLDNLIEPVNIMKHYTTLASVHPGLAHLKAFPDLGHLDFTLGVNEQLMSYIEDILRM